MSAKVTRAKAQKVLTAVRASFGVAAGEEGPALVMAWDWTGRGAHPAIVWEGGPYDWAILASGGGRDEWGLVHQPVEVPGTFLEPVTGWARGIWPE